jgi:hypothetical protein
MEKVNLGSQGAMVSGGGLGRTEMSEFYASANWKSRQPPRNPAGRAQVAASVAPLILRLQSSPALHGVLTNMLNGR